MNVAERMCEAWLRRFKKCQIVQSNIRFCRDWNACKSIDEEMKRLFVTMRSELNRLLFNGPTWLAEHLDDAKVKDILADMEVDAIGLNFAENEVTLCEVADHRNGLDYGNGAIETIEKVIEKILRCILFSKLYLGLQKINVVFISTVVKKRQRCRIKDVVEVLERATSDQDVSISTYLGPDVGSKIIKPLIDVSVKDKSEEDEFIRGVGLVTEYNILTDCTIVKDAILQHPRARKYNEAVTEIISKCQEEMQNACRRLGLEKGRM